MNLIESIEQRIRDYPQWSWAERARLAEITCEILRCCSSGDGNPFIVRWCKSNLADLFDSSKPAIVSRRRRAPWGK